MPRGPRAPHDLYSPERPTAVVLSGAGADGAYHAGVLKALHAAGVKVDLVAGRGVGVLGAVLSAVDGAALLWEPLGFWQRPALGHAYRPTWRYRAIGLTLLSILAVLALPLLLLAAAALVWPLAFGLGLLGLDWGAAVARGYADVVSWAYAPGAVADVGAAADPAAGWRRHPGPGRRGRLGGDDLPAAARRRPALAAARRAGRLPGLCRARHRGALGSAARRRQAGPAGRRAT